MSMYFKIKVVSVLLLVATKALAKIEHNSSNDEEEEERDIDYESYTSPLSAHLNNIFTGL